MSCIRAHAAHLPQGVAHYVFCAEPSALLRLWRLAAILTVRVRASAGSSVSQSSSQSGRPLLRPLERAVAAAPCA